MIEHVTDLDIHSPIGTDEHVAGGAFNHGIHHLRSPKYYDWKRNRIGEFPMNINWTSEAIGERFRRVFVVMCVLREGRLVVWWFRWGERLGVRIGNLKWTKQRTWHVSVELLISTRCRCFLWLYLINDFWEVVLRRHA